MRPRLVILVAVALAAGVPRPATAQTCKLATLKNCLDPTWRQSACGKQAAPDCAYQLAPYGESNYDADPTEVDPVLRPDGTAGSAKVARHDLTTMQSDQPATASFTGERARHVLATVGAKSTTGGTLPLLYASLMQEPTVGSCKDWVRKRWYDYANFEDIAATCGADDECVYQTALDPFVGLAKPYLRKYDLTGSVMDKQLSMVGPKDWLGLIWLPKNAFYELDPRVVYQQSAYAYHDPWENPDEAATFAAMLALTDGTDSQYVTTDLFAWHQQMHDAWTPLGLSLDEQSANDARQARYRALLAQYGRLRDELARRDVAITAGGYFVHGPNTASFPPADIAFYEGSYNFTVNTMTTLLREEWLRPGHGCLAGVACDWSPAAFRGQFVGLWQSEREQEMARCNRLTGGSVAGIPYEEPYYKPANPPYPAVNTVKGTRDVNAFYWWLEHKEREFQSLSAGLPYEKGGGTDTLHNRTLRWSTSPVHEEYGMENLLYAKYDQAGWVELGLQARSGDDGKPRVCRITGAAYGLLRAEAHWLLSPGLPERHVFIDAELRAGLERNAPANEGDSGYVPPPSGTVFDLHAFLRIDSNPVFSDINTTIVAGQKWQGPHDRGNFAKEKTQRFTILGIPAYAKVVVEAHPGFDTSVEVPQSFGPDCAGENSGGTRIDPVSHAVQLNLTGSVDAVAKGYLAIGIPGLSAGVKGEIKVLDARLPVFARVGFGTDGGALYLTFQSGARLEATLLSGSISVFAQILFKEAEVELYRWSGVPVQAELWSFERNLQLASLPTLFPE
jgi:hypothetical protein